jgi:hypothetical protein
MGTPGRGRQDDGKAQIDWELAVEMFITDAQLPHWEAMLESAEAQVRLSATTGLAWHLRERDSERSLLLVSEAKNLLEQVSLNASDRLKFSARLQLTTAEVKWLFSELETAQKLARAALTDFQSVKDFAGCADVHWLLTIHLPIRTQNLSWRLPTPGSDQNNCVLKYHKRFRHFAFRIAVRSLRKSAGEIYSLSTRKNYTQD